MNIAIDPAARKILDTLNKSATVRGIQEDYATLKALTLSHLNIRTYPITKHNPLYVNGVLVTDADIDNLYEEEIRTEAENERRSNEEAK